MAPTVCNKKEPHVRAGAVIRDSTKLLKNSTNSSTTTATSSLAAGASIVVGKIIHRRSIAVRSAKSKLTARRLADSQSSSSEESEIDDYSRMDEDDNFLTNNEVLHSPPTLPASPRDIIEPVPSPAIESDISAGCQCSDRLTIVTASPDSAYGSILCRYCNSPNTMQSSDSMETTTTDGATSTAINNEIVVFQRDRNEFSDESASNYSTYSSVWDSDDYSPMNFNNKYYVGQKSHRNSRGLLEIAVKTVKLIKRNQLLQRKLAQLQFETRQFIESVMANPENQNVHVKIPTEIERKKVEALNC